MEKGAGSRTMSYNINSMIQTKNCDKGAGSRTISYIVKREQGAGLLPMILIPGFKPKIVKREQRAVSKDIYIT